MAAHIFFCSKCKLYTLEHNCSVCQGLTIQKKPPKFSLNNKYAKYHRVVKKEELQKKNLF